MRFTCCLCFHPTDTAGQLLAHVTTVHPETGELPTTWPDGRDVTLYGPGVELPEPMASRLTQMTADYMARLAAAHPPDVEVETAVGQDVTHIKAWRREDFR